MKDIKLIRHDVDLVAWVMPQGGTWGGGGGQGVGGSIFFSEIQPNLACELLT